MENTKRSVRRPSAVTRRRRSVGILAVVVVIAVGFVAFSASRRGDRSGAAPSDGGQAVDPSAFAPGACVAFDPTSGNRHETVFLDAGHGGLDPGGVGVTEAGTSINEATETLPVELDVLALLRAKGFRTVVSRTADTTVVKLSPADVTQGTLTLVGAHDDVVARDQCADASGARSSSASTTTRAPRPTTPEASPPTTPIDRSPSANKKLAMLVQRDVVSRMDAQGWGIPDDGAQTDDQLGSLDGDPSTGGIAAQAAAYHHLLLLGPAAPGYFDTPSSMPGAVIEPLYITDPFEGSIAASAKGQKVIAQGIATAVEAFLGSRPG